MFDSDSDLGDGDEFGDLFAGLAGPPDDEITNGEFAKQLRAAGREAVAIRESLQSLVPLAERRRLLELQLGKDFVAQLLVNLDCPNEPFLIIDIFMIGLGKSLYSAGVAFSCSFCSFSQAKRRIINFGFLLPLVQVI